MKTNIGCILLLTLYLQACTNSTKQRNTKVEETCTSIAQIGLFEKVEFKFSEPNKKTIELQLYNSHLSAHTIKQEDIAKACAQKLIQAYGNVKGYDSIIVSLLKSNSKKYTDVYENHLYKFSTAAL